MKLGVVADPHLSVLRDEPASWHNPYRLVDAHDRLDTALTDPLFDDVDAFALLGDLAHFGDRESIVRCIDSVVKARRDRPAVLLSGNHDVLTPGIRLGDELEAWKSALDAADVFAAAGFGLRVHDVIELTERQVEPFDVRSRTVVADGRYGLVVLTHFPVLSFERRAREARLLYSGHLSQLAPAVDPIPHDGPVVVLSGHLHLRGVTHEANVLQLSFAALVEPPYEFALVELAPDGDALDVHYRCISAREPEAVKLPVLDPAIGRWRWHSELGWHQPTDTRW